MKFFRSTSPKVRNRVRLGVQTLEAREVPATLVPLDTVGATATVNGAILQQAGAVATNSGQFDTFLRLDDTGTEHGYNTDARPFQFDQLGDLTVTHSLLLADIPTVTIGNTVYREFYLHVRERQAAPRVTLDELRIFVSEVGNLANYSNANKTLAGNAAVFNLDGAGNVSVRLNDSLNGTTGKGDAFVLVPDSVFGGATYVYLYSKFGARNGASGGAEEWGVRPVVPPPPTGASISGYVYFAADGDRDREVDGNENFVAEVGLGGAVVRLHGFNDLNEFVDLTFTTVADESDGTANDGFFIFTGLRAGDYSLTLITDPPDYFNGPNTVGSAGGTDENEFSDVEMPDTISGIVVDADDVATDYLFGEFPAGDPN